jgi:hypothetical protein
VATLVLVISFWFENRRPFLGVHHDVPGVTRGVLDVRTDVASRGIPFGPVTATLAALAVGIGVPFTIHIARRFEEDRIRFESLEEAIRSTTRHTGGALAGSAFTTMAGFGILMTSSLKPFQQMGLVTAYAIGLSLVGAILVLPFPAQAVGGLAPEAWRRHRREGNGVGRVTGGYFLPLPLSGVTASGKLPTSTDEAESAWARPGTSRRRDADFVTERRGRRSSKAELDGRPRRSQAGDAQQRR